MIESVFRTIGAVRLEAGAELRPPIQTIRCRQIVVRHVDTLTHVDGKVFEPMATPAVVHSHPGALDLLVISNQ